MGLVVMFDFFWLEVFEAIVCCYGVGIVIIMVIGDYGFIVEAIVRSIGLVKEKVWVVIGDGLIYLFDV